MCIAALANVSPLLYSDTTKLSKQTNKHIQRVEEIGRERERDRHTFDMIPNAKI